MCVRPFLARRLDHTPRYIEHSRPACLEVLLDTRRKAIAKTMSGPVEEKLAFAPQMLEVFGRDVNMLLAASIGARDESRREDEITAFQKPVPGGGDKRILARAGWAGNQNEHTRLLSAVPHFTFPPQVVLSCGVSLPWLMRAKEFERGYKLE